MWKFVTKGVENVVAGHLSRMNHGQDDKEPMRIRWEMTTSTEYSTRILG
jgi:hypothetical protein